MRSRCEYCVFHSPQTNTCDYLFHTGVLRSTICPPGNECTEFKAKSGKRVKWDVVKGYYLYMEGKSWQEIANAVGVNRDKVYAYGCKYWPKRVKTEETKEEIPVSKEMSKEVKEEVQPNEPEKKAATPYDLLEVAIGERKGIDAYLTGVALGALLNWEDKADLEQARDAIKLLILRLQK